MADELDYICSVKFCENGSLLAAGLSSGNVVIMAFEGERAMRTVAGSRAPVSSLVWNGQILTTGSSTGQIFHYHLGIVESHMATFKIGRNLNVCSLQWSGDRRYLASGTSDSCDLTWMDTNLELGKCLCLIQMIITNKLSSSI